VYKVMIFRTLNLHMNASLRLLVVVSR